MRISDLITDTIRDFACPTVYMQGQEVSLITNPYSLLMWQTVIITVCIGCIQLVCMFLYGKHILKDELWWLP